MKINKFIYKIIIIIVLLFNINIYFCESYNLNELKDALREYNSNEIISLDKIIDNIVKGKGIEVKGIISIFFNMFFKEVIIALRSSISIFIILIIIMLLKSLELNKDSEINKVANFVCFLSVVFILLSTFNEVLVMFSNTTKNLGNIMQIISPFLMGVLIATGAITSSGIIQPLILFLSSFVGFIITNLIVPLLVLSVAFNIVDGLSSSIRLKSFSKLAYNTSLWIIGIFLTIFLGILSLETSITKEVDSLAVKSASAAVSNFVPIVGKFFSDSLEAVVGAGKITSKFGGVFAILTIVSITAIPLIKIFSIAIIYYILSSFSEILSEDDKICSVIKDFANIYKTMSGILIAVSILFIISIGIILNLVSSIV